MTTKFKIGDRVKILLSAVDGGVRKGDVGKIGKIISYSTGGGYFCVKMDYQNDNSDYLTWAVYPDQMERVVVVGQQLLLWEDMYE